MDTLVSHFESFQGLYIVLGIALLAVGGMLGFDTLTARRRRGQVIQASGPDHTRSVHTHHPWAGMGESGPDLP